MNSDCIVVGGGLIGMLTARMLAERGACVTLLERGETARESSWAGGGILSPLYPWRYPQAVTALAGWGQQYYPAFAEELLAETGVDPEWSQNGLLVLDGDEQDQAISWAQAHGIQLESCGAKKIAQIAPESCLAADTGLWLPEVAQIRNPRLAQALRKSLKNKGVDIIEHCEVASLLTDNTTIAGVQTTQGDKSAAWVVVAGGAWSRQLLEPVGISLKVEPVRGQMLLFATEPGVVSRIILHKGHYVIPRRDGHVLVGSTLEYVGFDKSVTADALAELRHAALEIVPALEPYPVEQHWAGLRPGSPDGIPYIGEHPEISGLFVNTGHFRNGVVLGPASAHLLIDIMTDQAPIVDTSPYQIVV